MELDVIILQAQWLECLTDRFEFLRELRGFVSALVTWWTFQFSQDHPYQRQFKIYIFEQTASLALAAACTPYIRKERTSLCAQNLMSNKQIEGLLTTRLLCSISSCILDYDNDSSDNDHDDNSSTFFNTQVVHYDPEGHYHCHHDSQDVDPRIPCCVFRDRRRCRLCRYFACSASLSISSVSYPAIYVFWRDDWGKVKARVTHGKGQSLPKSPCAL